MIINKKKNIRKFKVGKKKEITISEVAFIKLKANEQIVFCEKESNYDFVKKDWGYYATPSINGRLKKEGYKSALILNNEKKIYLTVVNKKKVNSFKKYCKTQNLKIYKWIDTLKI